MSVDRRAYGRRLREAREARKLTQGELAELSGVAQETTSRHENGRHAPNAELAQKWAGPLGVSPSWLLYGDSDVDRERAAPPEVEAVIAAMRLGPADTLAARQMAWNKTELSNTLGIVERITTALKEVEKRPPPEPGPNRKKLAPKPKKR